MHIFVEKEEREVSRLDNGLSTYLPEKGGRLRREGFVRYLPRREM